MNYENWKNELWIQVNLDMTDHCTADFCIWRTICLVPIRCTSSISHMYMTDFAYDGPIFLVPLSLSYPSSPVLEKIKTGINYTSACHMGGIKVYTGKCWLVRGAAVPVFSQWKMNITWRIKIDVQTRPTVNEVEEVSPSTNFSLGSNCLTHLKCMASLPDLTPLGVSRRVS